MKRGHRRRLNIRLPPVICKESGKHRHKDEAAADEQIEVLKLHRKRRDKTLHSYECEHCGGWHVGHSGKGWDGKQ